MSLLNCCLKPKEKKPISPIVVDPTKIEVDDVGTF